MATITKELLSGSTNGRQILVSATATAGTLIHTAIAGTGAMDELYLYLHNQHTGSVVTTIEYGGVTTPGDTIEVTIPADSVYELHVPGFLIQNSLVIRCFAATTNVITVNGPVARITA